MGRPCKCCKNFPFLVIIFIDESSPYRSQFVYDEDLRLLRQEQENIGSISIIIVQPETFFYPPQIFPDNTPPPEEVIAIYKNYSRGDTNSDIFKSIINDHIRDKYDCIGISVDSSGSTVYEEIRPGLECFYYNISDKKDGSSCEIYADPLPSCESGTLDLDRANGCVIERLFFTERWIFEAIIVARQLYERGCRNKKYDED